MTLPILVFDMDGVLVDVTESYRETIVQTVEYFTGRQIDRAVIQEYKNQGGWNNDWALSHKLCADLGTEVGYHDVVVRFQELFLGKDGRGGLVEHELWFAAPGLLERLAARYRLAVFTGRPRAEAELTIRRFSPALGFDPLIGDEDVQHHKPHPEGLEKIAALYPSTPLLYVGDTADDARCARSAGVPFIGIVDPANPRAADVRRLMEAEGARAVIENLNQIEGVLAE